jgi:hypothetical protein
MLREFFLFVLSAAVLIAGFAAVWIFFEKRKKLQRRFFIGSVALVGAILLGTGLARHFTGDISPRGGGKYGPQFWYQNVTAGSLMLIAALIGAVTRPSKDEDA